MDAVSGDSLGQVLAATRDGGEVRVYGALDGFSFQVRGANWVLRQRQWHWKSRATCAALVCLLMLPVCPSAVCVGEHWGSLPGSHSHRLWAAALAVHPAGGAAEAGGGECQWTALVVAGSGWLCNPPADAAAAPAAGFGLLPLLLLPPLSHRRRAAPPSLLLLPPLLLLGWT